MKRQSLISKMRLLNLIGIAAAMLFVLVVLSFLYSWFARHTLIDKVMSDACLLATNTAPMLAFHDQKESTTLATTFKKTSNLHRVRIFDHQHELFVDIATENKDHVSFPVNEQLPSVTKDTVRFEDNYLLVFVPIFIEKERMGTVVLEKNLTSIRNDIIVFVSIAAAATFLGALLSTLILKRLHLWVLAPIIDMSKLAEQVATDKNYQLRAKVIGEDEIASLALRFNQMLTRIEIWDKDLNDEIVQRRKSEEYLDNLARTDALTQLSNRFAFMGDIKSAVSNAIKKDQPLVLLFIDLDDFKIVNDNYGHHCGDSVLQVTAQRLAGMLRGADKLYRLGGDEFAVMLKDVTKKELAFQLSDRLIDKVSEPIALGDNSASVTVQIGISIGLAFCPEHASSTTDLLRRADLAMYAAKRDGKNGFKQFVPEME